MNRNDGPMVMTLRDADLFESIEKAARRPLVSYDTRFRQGAVESATRRVSSLKRRYGLLAAETCDVRRDLQDLNPIAPMPLTRHRHSGFTHAGNLVAEGALADAQAVRNMLAAATFFPQGIQDDLFLHGAQSLPQIVRR